MSYGGQPQGNYYGGGPPPQRYSHSPQPGYGQPQGSYQQPPYPGQSGAYPPPQHGGYPPGPPPPGPYGGHPPPPQQGFGQQGPPPPMGYDPSLMPSPGYDPHAPMAPGDASRDADTLRAAMKGFGTDESKLIRVLSKPDANQMRLLVHTYHQRLGRNLEKDIKSETSGHFEDGLLALVRGPLAQDVHLLHRAIKGLGTKESYLNDVLLLRSNADLRAIKHLYQQTYHHSLESDVKGDLSFKTADMFSMVLAANRTEESAPFDPGLLDRDIQDLHHATVGRGPGTDERTVYGILTSRSTGHVRAIAQGYATRYHTPLATVISREFSGHMKDALLLIVARAEDRAMADATQLEDTMKGVGTREEALLHRVIRLHWDRDRMDQAKRAYRYRYGKDVQTRIRGEVGGHLEKLLLAVLE